MSQLYIDCEPDKPHWGWSWLERWMAARPWENRVFDSSSVSKDVFDSYSVRSLDMDKSSAHKQDARLHQHSPSYRNQPTKSAPVQARTSLRISPETYCRAPSYANGQCSPLHRTSKTPPPAHNSKPLLIRSASPRACIRREDIEEAASQVSTTGKCIQPQFC